MNDASIFDCRHDDCELRRRRIVSGAIIAGKQCLRCGHWNANGITKRNIDNFDSLPWFDEDFRDSRWRRVSETIRAKREHDREEWWARYDAYLGTTEWRRRADAVLRRANHTCEACGSARATEVHHTTYAHIFQEPLFDLRAVCRECHLQITTLDRERRGGI